MSNQLPADESLPEALTDERRRVSLVWLIPLVAVFAAVWLGYRAYTQQGPLVTISFETAEGLEAGKTRVRFKELDVGLVETIELSPDLSRVKVRARLVNHVADHLNDQTRFWVVRPRLSSAGVSGLGTLVGGTYIGVDLGSSGTPQRVFKGLETPPIVTATDPGRIFNLQVAALGSLSIGSPVHYRGIEVGRVIGYRLQEPHGVSVRVFVHAPHDAKVGVNTRFWNVSGMQMSLDAAGVQLSTDSLASMLLGGVAFGVAADAAVGERAPKGAEFTLYPTRNAALERRYERRQEWRVAFVGSVRGLLPGAPVELRGIRVGEVKDVRLELDTEGMQTHTPVTLSIEPDRLGITGAGSAEGKAAPAERELWNHLVRNGLRAQLKTGNLITGALYVHLDFYPGDPPREIVWGDGVPELPTVLTPLDELRGVLTRLARLPLDRMGEDLSQSLAALRETMQATNALLARLDQETATELTKTLQQTRRTLANAEKMLAPNSSLQAEAHRALSELSSAARSFRIMADYLERHPEALIRGKGDVKP